MHVFSGMHASGEQLNQVRGSCLWLGVVSAAAAAMRPAAAGSACCTWRHCGQLATHAALLLPPLSPTNLLQLTGIAAILRFPLPDLEDQEFEAEW